MGRQLGYFRIRIPLIHQMHPRDTQEFILAINIKKLKALQETDRQKRWARKTAKANVYAGYIVGCLTVLCKSVHTVSMWGLAALPTYKQAAQQTPFGAEAEGKVACVGLSFIHFYSFPVDIHFLTHYLKQCFAIGKMREPQHRKCSYLG